MLKEYKNEVYRIIKEVVMLDPNRFYITDGNYNTFPVSQISTIDSKMSFWFRNRPNSWKSFDYKQTKFCPDFIVSNWIPNNGQTFNFQQLSGIFIQWLTNHVKPFFEEQDIVDKWNAFQFEIDIFHLLEAGFGDNTNFTNEDSKTISKSLDYLKQLIIDKFNPIDEQLHYMNERLDFLSEAVSRLGKFDWKSQFVSIMISIAINMTFDKETGNAFFRLIQEAFSEIKNIISGS